MSLKSLRLSVVIGICYRSLLHLSCSLSHSSCIYFWVALVSHPVLLCHKLADSHGWVAAKQRSVTCKTWQCNFVLCSSSTHRSAAVVVCLYLAQLEIWEPHSAVEQIVPFSHSPRYSGALCRCLFERVKIVPRVDTLAKITNTKLHYSWFNSLLLRCFNLKIFFCYKTICLSKVPNTFLL